MSAADVLEVPVRSGPVAASLTVPGSKSIANRVLTCAALAEGVTSASNLPDGDDTTAMLDCLSSLGLSVSRGPATATIEGHGAPWSVADATLQARLAGTTSRFVTALAALGDGPITVDGDAPLRGRPFGPLHEALTQMGVGVHANRAGHLPVVVTGPPTVGDVTIRGDVSSQFVSALMMIGPLVPGGLTLRLSTPLVSRPYVELTASVMSWFGGAGVELSDDLVRVPPGGYQGVDVAVEADASSASYPLAIGAVCGGAVTVEGLGDSGMQGDAAFADLLRDMGCRAERTSTTTTVSSNGDLNGVDVDMADISDLVPTVAVVAAFASSPTRIRGVGFIRGKESDRLGDLAAELSKSGVDIDETDDGLEIRPSRDRLRPARLATHHDHRLAMAFGVLGARVGGTAVEDPSVVSKSWPDYWRSLDQAFA